MIFFLNTYIFYKIRKIEWNIIFNVTQEKSVKNNQNTEIF